MKRSRIWMVRTAKECEVLQEVEDRKRSNIKTGREEVDMEGRTKSIHFHFHFIFSAQITSPSPPIFTARTPPSFTAVFFLLFCDLGSHTLLVQEAMRQ